MPASAPTTALIALAALLACAACESSSGPERREGEWLRRTVAGVVLEYQSPDADIAAAMLQRVASGRETAAGFLARDYTAEVTVRLYPSAESFAAAWRGRTGAAPLCWMIADGSAGGVTMLSPRVWSSAACGHDGADPAYVQGVVTHELVHVLHHRHNPDPGRLQREAEWFEEGLAVLAAGQLDAAAKAQVRQRVEGGFAPATLAAAWEESGIAYPVGGSLVHYIDTTYGRAALRGLTGETTEAGLLAALGVSEAALLQGWRAFAAAY